LSPFARPLTTPLTGIGHEKEAGFFTTVSTLVNTLSDNPAAKLTAQQILERVQRAQRTPAPAG